MAASACFKRCRSVFDDLHDHTSPTICKRLRCAAAAGGFNQGNVSIESHLERLKALFPHLDPMFLERTLKASGNDLDSAIKRLNGLHLESIEQKPGFAASNSDSGVGTAVQLPTEAADIMNTSGDVTSEDKYATEILPQDGSGWVELLVREMMKARDVEDAKLRASRVLEVLGKSIASQSASEATQSFQKEIMLLKEQNKVLGQKMSIQHERLQDYEGTCKELEHVRQLLSQHRERVRILEVNNYALTMHLEQAQRSSSIPGHFHPDIF